MSAKAEIGWKGRTADGERREVYARHVGGDWRFYERSRRYDEWHELPDPPLADWLELLDAIERIVQRQRQRPEEPNRIRRTIRSRFPEAGI
jgi:transposase